MRLKDLMPNQKIIIQMIWGEQKIEFYSTVQDHRNDGIISTPYFHNGSLLELNIEHHGAVVCHVFADNPSTGSRISWKNVKIQTIESNKESVYFITTGMFNALSHADDNRKHDRLIIRKSAHIYEAETKSFIDIMIHDISDYGISFYAPQSYKPASGNVTIVFADNVNDKDYQLKIECQIARTEQKAGVVFYGCKVVGENKAYLTYGFLKRLKEKHTESEDSE